MKYNNCLIDEENENNKVVYTVWESNGIYHLGTFGTLNEAKHYVDTKAEKDITKIKNMRRKNNR